MIEIPLGGLPLGDVPRDNSPLGEYHCIRPDPRYDGWEEPTNHWTWQGSNWRVGEDPGGRHLEQCRRSLFNNTLITRTEDWRDVQAAETEVLSDSSAAEVGLVFACRTALDYLCLHLEGDRVKLSRRRDECFEVVGESGPVEAAGRWVRPADAGPPCLPSGWAGTLHGAAAGRHRRPHRNAGERAGEVPAAPG